MPSPYLPNTDADRSIMLREIGVGSIEELFQDIPQRFRRTHFNLPLPLSELEVKKELKQQLMHQLKESKMPSGYKI